VLVKSDAAGVEGPGVSGLPATSAIDGLGWLFSRLRIADTSEPTPLMLFIREQSGEAPLSLGVVH
jgi:hypothetical protein